MYNSVTQPYQYQVRIFFKVDFNRPSGFYFVFFSYVCLELCGLGSMHDSKSHIY